MSPACQAGEGRNAEPGRLGCLDVVLLYDEVETGKRAKIMAEQSLLRAGGELEAEFHIWSFAVLALPAVLERVRTTVQNVDLAIVAVRHSGWLRRRETAHWTEWLRSAKSSDSLLLCVVSKSIQHPSELVALVDGVRMVACQAEMPHRFALPPALRPWLWHLDLFRHSSNPSYAASAEGLPHLNPHFRWGLNE